MNTAKQDWAGLTGKALDLNQMEELAKQYDEKWAVVEERAQAAKEARAEFDIVEDKIMKALEEAQKTSYKSELGTYTIQSVPTVKVASTIEEKKQLFQYLRKLGEDVYMSMLNVNSTTLNSWYKKVKEDAGSPAGFAIPGVKESGDRVTLRFFAAKKGK